MSTWDERAYPGSLSSSFTRKIPRRHYGHLESRSSSCVSKRELATSGHQPLNHVADTVHAKTLHTLFSCDMFATDYDPQLHASQLTGEDGCTVTELNLDHSAAQNHDAC